MSTQTERALLLARIIAQFEQRVNEFLDYSQTHPEASFAELETEARRLGRDCFAPALQASIDARRERVEQAVRCQCGGTPTYKGEQERTQETYVGRIELRRAYYYCSACRKGRYPLDEALGVGPGQFSDGLQAGVSRLGAGLPFEPAAETLTALTGVGISPREVERVVEGRGAALEEHLAAEREKLLRGEGEPPAVGPRDRPGVWAVALDAAKARFEDGWHEVKAGVVFWARPNKGGDEIAGAKAEEQSYVAEVGSMEKAGERLYAEVVRRGIDTAEEKVVCLGDGAVANWNQFALHFPKRVEILDWWHGVEHLWAAGEGVFGEGTLEAGGWVEARKAELWDGKVEEVIDALRREASKPGKEVAEGQIHYFETNKERMRYDQFRAKGYPIGSGTVESACKRLIGARVKQAGMCWTKAGAQAVLSLRAGLLSGRWDENWQATRPLREVA